jgi:hypothetical protein
MDIPGNPYIAWDQVRQAMIGNNPKYFEFVEQDKRILGFGKEGRDSITEWYLNKPGLNQNDKAVLLRSHIRVVANMVPIDFNDLSTDWTHIDVL